MLILTQNVPRTNLVTLTQRGSHLECSACDLLPVVTFRVHEARCRAPSVIITKQQRSLHISHMYQISYCSKCASKYWYLTKNFATHISFKCLNQGIYIFNLL